jgi:hypothetical protein
MMQDLLGEVLNQLKKSLVSMHETNEQQKLILSHMETLRLLMGPDNPHLFTLFYDFCYREEVQPFFSKLSTRMANKVVNLLKSTGILQEAKERVQAERRLRIISKQTQYCKEASTMIREVLENYLPTK